MAIDRQGRGSYSDDGRIEHANKRATEDTVTDQRAIQREQYRNLLNGMAEGSAKEDFRRRFRHILEG